MLQIRENVLESLVRIKHNDMNTVNQLTPILDTLTQTEEEITDIAEVLILFLFQVFIFFMIALTCHQ